MSPVATRSVTSGRLQCWKLKFYVQLFKFLYHKKHALYFVEIYIVEVKLIVISYLKMIYGFVQLRSIYENFNFGDISIGTQCIIKHM